jgi:ribosomal protein S3
MAHANNEPFNVEFLIEPNKVGRVVGPKGATIHNLKSKSQLSQLRVSKEPQVSIRFVNILLTRLERQDLDLHKHVLP